MKNKIILPALLLTGTLFGSSSCSDMLTPDMVRYNDGTSVDDTLYNYLGILKSVQKIAERNVILGETRGDLVSTTEYTSDSISQLFNFEVQEDGENAILQAADYYYVINQCNFYLQNCDSGIVKDQYKYMQKEWVQVQAIRAWTYMQLVNNYGEVPFVTVPVSDSEIGKELSRTARRISKDNIADLLYEAGLFRAYELQYLTAGSQGYPSYNSYNNGSVSIPSRSCFFSSALVLADLYLMQNKYKEAAAMYYNFMREEAASLPGFSENFNENIEDDGTHRYVPNGNWTDAFRGYNTGTNSDLITLIPGAANKANGFVFTQLANIYGFRTSSTAGGVGSGSMSMFRDETYRQLCPSKSYTDLNAEQLYCNYRMDAGGEVQEYYAGAGDARFQCSAPLSLIEGVNYNFITKYAPAELQYDYVRKRMYARSFNTFYGVRVYRKSLVQLRFAEAVNRAGFPEHAFSVLKDGIATDNYPILSYRDVVRIDTLKDEAGEPLIDEETGEIMTDTVVIESDVPYLIPPQADAGGAYYISIDEVERAKTQASALDVYNFLDFSVNEFMNDETNIRGIHGRGCGETRGYRDTLYTYDRCVAQKIALKRVEAGILTGEEMQEFADSVISVTVVQAVADGTVTHDEVIEAVEDLIIDELALETAFEGNRYYDLLRFANHKGNGTMDNEWLARKIASRGYSPGYVEGAVSYDAALYGRLVSGSLWYLQLPEEE